MSRGLDLSFEKGNKVEIDISGRHFHVTPALKNHVTERVKKLDKYALKLETVHVVLEVQKFLHISEIVLRGKNLRVTAKGESTDMYAAFDKTFGNIQLQLGKLHEKRRDHKARRYEAEEV